MLSDDPPRHPRNLLVRRRAVDAVGDAGVLECGVVSMCVCKNCTKYIDSDDDPDCFVEVGNMRRYHETIILCERCREERLEKEEADASQRSRAESQSEQSEKEQSK